ncbi:tripartite tricarboxylate transporter TctB family protein [Virgibacillus ndiopensis]|uniref:tripartite tricarboxylate transporter TctB family protein n=1 Tax=Virgibacillus ndiopensis TaxID=2004408 RepID=UPI000C0816BE|nr:tripartite tricarboxylate transporter TctB family protein [Virgibacillus ndiopensis]
MELVSIIKKNDFLPFLFPLLLILFSILLIIGSVYSPNIFGSNGQVIGSKEYSIGLSIILILVSISQMINIKKSTIIVKEKMGAEAKKKITQTTIAIFFFVIGFSYVGFYTTSIIIVFIMGMIMNNWNKKKITSSITFSIALAIVLYFLFDLINIYLPNTWLI